MTGGGRMETIRASSSAIDQYPWKKMTLGSVQLFLLFIKGYHCNWFGVFLNSRAQPQNWLTDPCTINLVAWKALTTSVATIGFDTFSPYRVRHSMLKDAAISLRRFKKDCRTQHFCVLESIFSHTQLRHRVTGLTAERNIWKEWKGWTTPGKKRGKKGNLDRWGSINLSPNIHTWPEIRLF